MFDSFTNNQIYPMSRGLPAIPLTEFSGAYIQPLTTTRPGLGCFFGVSLGLFAGGKQWTVEELHEIER